jgi:hypothetical protein
VVPSLRHRYGGRECQSNGKQARTNPLLIAATVGKDLRSNTRREHCILAGLPVRYRSTGKSKWKFRSTQPSETPWIPGRLASLRKMAPRLPLSHSNNRRRIACEFVGIFLFWWRPSPLLAAEHWAGRRRRSARPRSFRVLRMTERSTTARRTRGMARDWCDSGARRPAKRTSRGATTKKEFGWTRDAAVSLLWGAVRTAAMPAARVGEGR